MKFEADPKSTGIMGVVVTAHPETDRTTIQLQQYIEILTR
jgi:hypothetical protein